MAKQRSVLKVGTKNLEVSNLDKVFYPATGFTKGDVIDFYREVSPALLPHLKNRAATLKRYPDGVEGSFFYEKRCPGYRPDWMKTVEVVRKRDDKPIPYCLLNDEAALVWAANLANLELHTSLARARDVSRPIAVVFDLDPGAPADVVDCAEVAIWIRDLCAQYGLESFCKTSGSKGLQLYVPLNTKVSFDDTGTLARAIATALEEVKPDRVVSKMKKELRGGKVLIDWSQNNDHKTTVSVYSLRAKERPTVSTPITWYEVEKAVRLGRAEELTFDPGQVLRRIDEHGDLFEPVLKLNQKLPKIV